MRKRFWVLLVCAALLACGCSAGTSDAELAESLGIETVKEETTGETGAAEQKAEDKETAKEEKAKTQDTGKKEKEEQKQEEGKTAEKSSKENKEEENSEEKKSEEKKSEERKSEEKKSEEEKSEEKTGKDENSKEKKSDTKESDTKKSDTKKSDAKKSDTGESDTKSDKKNSEKKKAAEEQQYIPDGFTPYGDYVLIYDSGYTVKTRYSEAGLTYYWESEEFLFKLNKDLPDMKQETAHILFNTAAPMDPSNTEGEEFPYQESYIIYISLYDGSYYEVGRGSLDLRGRVFVRDVFESFRQKWEGSF